MTASDSSTKRVDMFRLDGLVALVTGASAGLGAAIAYMAISTLAGANLAEGGADFPLLRHLFRDLGVSIPELWAQHR